VNGQIDFLMPIHFGIMSDQKLIEEYGAIKPGDFTNVADFFNARAVWIRTKLINGDLKDGSETHATICNMRSE
jgi:hypothetical protein